jgi:environmental stress-induced protein Ves
VTRNVKRPGHLLRQYETYRAMPWRNGRGFTLEIAREPVEEENFAWRLSLAEIDRDAEFSAYPGYRRALVLVAGNALHLRFRGHGKCFLDPTKPGTRFEGDWKTHCAVPQGRCTDLSLIVRRGPFARSRSVVRAPRVLRVQSAARVALAGNLYGAIFVLQGSLEVAESIRARPLTLRARDTLLLAPGRQRGLRLRSIEPSAARLVMLCWRPARHGD